MVIIDHVLIWLFYLLAALPPLFSGSWDLWTLCLIHFLTLLLVFFFCWLRVRRHDRISLTYTASDPYFLVFLAICFLSYLFSPNRFNSRNELFNQINYYLLFYLALNLLDSDFRRTGFRYLLYPISAFIGLLAVKQAWAHQMAVGTLLNPNILAGYIIAIVPLLLADLQAGEAGTGRERVIYAGKAGLLVLLLVVLALTHSFGGWLSLFLALIFFLWLQDKYALTETSAGYRLATYAGLGVIGAALLYFAVMKMNEPGVLNRLDWWAGAWKIVKQYPILGVGLGNFDTLYLRYKTGELNSLYAHNHFLQLWCEVGLIGVVALLGGIYQSLKGFMANLTGLPRSGKILTIGVACSLTAMLLNSLVDYSLYIPAVAILFWILLGYGQSALPRRTITLKRNWGLLIAFSALMVWAGISFVNTFWASQRYMAGTDYLHNGQLTLAEANLLESIKLDPLNAQTYAFLSEVYKQERQPGTAVHYLQEAIKLNPNYGPFHHNLAWLYSQQGDPPGAIREAQSAVACHPHKALYHYSLGIFYKENGLTQPAQKEFQEAQDLAQNVYNK